MSASNNERPWAPAELDALEDALESLELAAPPALPGTLVPEQQQRIAERLASYRAIAGLSRELLVAHVAPTGAIDAVLAEARRVAETGVVASEVAAPLAPARGSWWSRAKRLWLVPTLASAGVGALVAVLAVNQQRDAPAEPLAATTPRDVDGRAAKAGQASPAITSETRATPPLAMAEPRADDDAEGDNVERGAAAQSGEGERGRLLERKSKAEKAEEEAQAQPAETTKEDADELVSKDVADKKRPETPPRSTPAAPPPDPAMPSAEPKAPSTKPSKSSPKPKTPAGPSAGGTVPGSGGGVDPSPAAVGDVLVRADRERRNGDCAGARKDYELVIAKGDRKQRARAKAGTALCLEREGAEARAGDLIAGARLDDPGIDAWIADERSTPSAE